ncbi:MAG TPA: hypothetical protein VF629_24145, partial [Hymenobacter sp.]|uniref:hypothetical protein n=1 Tax=Hymenobacter sp. TaxID=1898978 RepID=UPI002ED80649
MKLLFRSSFAALGLLAFLTNCATTVTEKEKPSVVSQTLNAPLPTNERRPDSTGAATTAPDAQLSNTPPAASAPLEGAPAPAPDAASAAALAADRPDP